MRRLFRKLWRLVWRRRDGYTCTLCNEWVGMSHLHTMDDAEFDAMREDAQREIDWVESQLRELRG